MIDCPWPASSQLPVHYCEENLCAWVAQPANTWSNIGYLIAAVLILKNKNLNNSKYGFAMAGILLFVGSGLYHMTGTYWAHKLDIGAMLFLSAYVLSLTMVNFFQLNQNKLLPLSGLIFLFSIPHIAAFWGGRIFIIQVLTAATVEIVRLKKQNIEPERKKWILTALGVFLFALGLNVLDMKRIYCLPLGNLLTLHALWHLLCAYSIYLATKYYTAVKLSK